MIFRTMIVGIVYCLFIICIIGSWKLSHIYIAQVIKSEYVNCEWKNDQKP